VSGSRSGEGRTSRTELMHKVIACLGLLVLVPVVGVAGRMSFQGSTEGTRQLTQARSTQARLLPTCLPRRHPEGGFCFHAPTKSVVTWGGPMRSTRGRDHILRALSWLHSCDVSVKGREVVAVCRHNPPREASDLFAPESGRGIGLRRRD
jgi:hypothetical protein